LSKGIPKFYKRIEGIELPFTEVEVEESAGPYTYSVEKSIRFLSSDGKCTTRIKV
jgi:hypothetical protein